MDDRSWARVCWKVAGFYAVTAHCHDPEERLEKAESTAAPPIGLRPGRPPWTSASRGSACTPPWIDSPPDDTRS